MMPRTDKARPAASLVELKTYLKIEHSAEDALLAAFLLAATETVEALVGQVLVEREIEEQLAVDGRPISLMAEPVKNLISAGRRLADGSLQPVEITLRPDRFGAGVVQPEGMFGGAELVIRYRAGLAADWNHLPELVRLAVIRLAGHFHAFRDDETVPGVPLAVRQMLAPWRVRRLN